MADRVQYVQVQFHHSVSSPLRASEQEKSVYLDAFERDEKRKRVLVLEREGDAVIATDIASGRVREYPWASVRQATRADDRYEHGDPRGKLKVKPVEAKAASK